MAYNILVVDDSKTVRKMISRAIDVAGIDVNELREAGDGEEALVLLREKWIDLVLTDINMPRMDGMQLVDEMWSDDLLRQIPVIVVSTEGSEQRIAELWEKGIRGYLRKPFTPENIKAAVESALEGEHV